MKYIIAAAIIVATAVVLWSGTASAAGQPGETSFKQNCVACHPGGGNIINPQKTLHKKDRDANNVKTADAIVKIMRNPGPGMTKFDEKTIPNKEAHEIAEYIIKTFQ